MKTFINTILVTLCFLGLASCGSKAPETMLDSEAKSSPDVAELKGPMSNLALETLKKASMEVLGEEFFSSANIGGASVISLKKRSVRADDLVKRYYKTLKLNTEPRIATNPSQTDVDDMLFSMLIDVKISNDPEVQKKAIEIRDLIMQAIHSNSNIVVVSGSWTDIGLGDPSAAYVVLVDFDNQQALILEQGYAD